MISQANATKIEALHRDAGLNVRMMAGVGGILVMGAIAADVRVSSESLLATAKMLDASASTVWYGADADEEPATRFQCAVTINWRNVPESVAA